MAPKLQNEHEQDHDHGSCAFVATMSSGKDLGRIGGGGAMMSAVRRSSSDSLTAMATSAKPTTTSEQPDVESQVSFLSVTSYQSFSALSKRTTTTLRSKRTFEQTTAEVDDDAASACSSQHQQELLSLIAAHSESDNSAEKPIPFSQRQVSRLAFGAAGIYVAYLYHGHIQEDLFHYQSPENGATFRSVWLLQAFESAANILLGFCGRKVFGGRKNLSLRPFFASGVSQVFAKAFTSLALAAGLSFPVCILAKSAKIVPVMLGQLMLGGSHYGIRDYLFACFIVAGTAMLSSGSSKADHPVIHNSSTPFGVLFIVLSLVLDGLTAGFQKRLKCTYSAAPPTTYDFLLYTNMAMAAVAWIMSIVTWDMMTGLAFLKANPAVATMIVKVCVCSCLGQSFIFFVVASFDPLVCSTITTTRKMGSVLWSVYKGHNLSNQGGVGLVLAMLGLFIEVQGKVIRMSKDGPAGKSSCSSTTTTTAPSSSSSTA